MRNALAGALIRLAHRIQPPRAAYPTDINVAVNLGGHDAAGIARDIERQRRRQSMTYQGRR